MLRFPPFVLLHRANFVFLPNNQTLREERERRLALVATWVVEFPRQGKSEKQLTDHIRREFNCCHMTAYSYRKTARERLGDCMPSLDHLAGVLLEWGQQTYDQIERSRASPHQKAKLRTALLSTMGRLCPKHVFLNQPPAGSPPFSLDAQMSFLRGEPATADTNGESCE